MQASLRRAASSPPRTTTCTPSIQITPTANVADDPARRRRLARRLSISHAIPQPLASRLNLTSSLNAEGWALPSARIRSRERGMNHNSGDWSPLTLLDMSARLRSWARSKHYAWRVFT